jgi:hypothetical protein
MCPRQTMQHPPDELLGDTISQGKCALRYAASIVLTTDGSYRLVGEFGSGLRASSLYPGAPPPFGNHVQGVVSHRSKPKVRWVHASRGIAVMQYQQPIWNTTVVQLPSNTRRLQRPALLTANRQLSVAFRVPRCSPNPAGTSLWTDQGNRTALVDLWPEPLRNRLGAWGHGDHFTTPVVIGNRRAEAMRAEVSKVA